MSTYSLSVNQFKPCRYNLEEVLEHIVAYFSVCFCVAQWVVNVKHFFQVVGIGWFIARLEAKVMEDMSKVVMIVGIFKIWNQIMYMMSVRLEGTTRTDVEVADNLVNINQTSNIATFTISRVRVSCARTV